MDELEGYLQCFDKKHRGIVIRHVRDQLAYYQQPVVERFTPPLFQIVLSFALGSKNAVLCHKLIDMRPKEDLPFQPEYSFCTEMVQLMYDRGIRYINVMESDEPQFQRFLDCRDRARSVAIAVLGCFSHGRSAAVGEKDVGKIIGRAIWASRGIKEWMN
jgi:hypothetical protein